MSLPARLVLVVSLAGGAVSSGAGIVITRDGGTVFVANADSGSVSAVDTRTGEKAAEVAACADPRGLALSGDGRFLYVACRGSGAVAILTAQPLALVQSIAVGVEPYDVVASGRHVYVSSTADDSVVVMEHPRVRSRRFPGGARVAARIAVGPRPKGLALSVDESVLYATHFLSGQVSVIDTARGAVSAVISTGADSNMVQRIVLQGDRAYVPHIRSNTSNRFQLFDTTVFPVVSVIDLASRQAVPRERLDLSLGATAVNLPFDIAFAADGRFAYVVGLGSGDLSKIDLQTRQRVERIEVGDGPGGIVLAPDGRMAYVANSLSGDISVVDLTVLRETRRVKVTTSPLTAQVQRGKLLFFSSRSTETSRDRWISCATCHFDGEHDGRTWFTSVGIRNTTSLRGMGDTRPVHWSADRDELQDFEFTIRDLQAGTGLMRGRAPNPPRGLSNAGISADLDAMAAYVETLGPKANPFTHDAGAVDRGRTIFENPSVGCARCHAGLRLTDLVTHNVGTGDGPDEPLGPAFDTPSLRALWDSAPYLHDGSAPTLRDVVGTRNPADRHGRTSQLTEADVRDLVAFLMSL